MKKPISIFMIAALLCAMLAGVTAAAEEPIAPAYSETLTQDVIDYMEDLGEDEIVPVWIYLTCPSGEEIEVMVQESVSEELSPQEYYEARLRVLAEIFGSITGSFAENYLDDSCTILYQGHYTAMLVVEAPKHKVLELAENDLVVEIALFVSYEQLPELEVPMGEPVSVHFDDVDLDAYYATAVQWAAEQGITYGTDEAHFSPNQTCSRAEVVTFLWRAAGTPEATATSCPFDDVNVDAFYFKAVLWAVENEITTGTATNKFSPDKGCTRGEVVTFLWRAAESPDPAATNNPFTDVKDDAFYGKAVLWAAENEITVGTTDTTFSPEKTCSRAEIVTFLYRNME